jgi:hypothetical protein
MSPDSESLIKALFGRNMPDDRDSLLQNQHAAVVLALQEAKRIYVSGELRTFQPPHEEGDES